jgi:hypothetical protein
MTNATKPTIAELRERVEALTPEVPSGLDTLSDERVAEIEAEVRDLLAWVKVHEDERDDA